MRLGGGLRLHTGGHPLAAIGTEQGARLWTNDRGHFVGSTD